MKLWHKVLLGLALGVGFGYLIGQTPLLAATGLDGQYFLTVYVKPVGTVFIHMIKMVVVPLIFFSLISGITSMTDADSFKRVGLKAVGAYLCTGAFAVVIGLSFGHLFAPGVGVDLSSLQNIAGSEVSGTPPAAQTEGKIAADAEGAGVEAPGTEITTAEAPVEPAAAVPVEEARPIQEELIEMLVDIVPSNVFKAMVDDHILQVVVFAIFTAVILNGQREKVPELIRICHQAAQVVFKMIEAVIKFSPYGVFALTAWVVGTQGFDILIALVHLIAVVFGALGVQYLLFGLMTIVFGRMSPIPFYRKMIEPQSLAFSTSSSKATLSTAMRIASEKLGISRSSTSFVLPLGASINMDGTAIYLGICALFFSQAFGIPLDTHQYMVLILTATLGSIGAAGIPGGSLIMMGMVLTSVGLPLEGIALIAGIDRILDMVRTLVNITGDCLITMLVDKSEGSLDTEVYYDMSK